MTRWEFDMRRGPFSCLPLASTAALGVARAWLVGLWYQG